MSKGFFKKCGPDDECPNCQELEADKNLWRTKYLKLSDANKHDFTFIGDRDRWKAIADKFAGACIVDGCLVVSDAHHGELTDAYNEWLFQYDRMEKNV